MAGLLSKGASFSFKSGTSSSFTEVANLIEIPSLGGTVDKVDVTTLADESRHYIPGLIDYGDLAFRFLYDNSSSSSNYRVMKALDDTTITVKVTFPDTTTFEFDCIPKTAVDGAQVGAALYFTVNCALQSDIDVQNPTT